MAVEGRTLLLSPRRGAAVAARVPRRRPLAPLPLAAELASDADNDAEAEGGKGERQWPLCRRPSPAVTEQCGAHSTSRSSPPRPPRTSLRLPPLPRRRSSSQAARSLTQKMLAAQSRSRGTAPAPRRGGSMEGERARARLGLGPAMKDPHDGRVTPFSSKSNIKSFSISSLQDHGIIYCCSNNALLF